MKEHTRCLGRVLVLVLLAVGTTMGAGAEPQRTARGTLGGQVLGTDGKAISGARVLLQTSDGKAPRSTETNAQGRFWFPMLPAGLYDARAYSQGSISEWRQNVLVVGRQTSITLHLRPRKHVNGKLPSSLTPPHIEREPSRENSKS